MTWLRWHVWDRAKTGFEPRHSGSRSVHLMTTICYLVYKMVIPEFKQNDFFHPGHAVHCARKEFNFIFHKDWTPYWAYHWTDYLGFDLGYNRRVFTRPRIISHIRGVNSSCSQGLPGGPVVRIHASAAGGIGSIPGQGTKIPQIVWPGQKKKKKKLAKKIFFSSSLYLNSKLRWMHS